MENDDVHFLGVKMNIIGTKMNIIF